MTPWEALRCQGVDPSSYEWDMSDSEIRRSAGNSMTVPVVENILRFILRDLGYVVPLREARPDSRIIRIRRRPRPKNRKQPRNLSVSATPATTARRNANHTGAKSRLRLKRTETRPRSGYVQRDDILHRGPTLNCPGCRAILKGAGPQTHTAACRARVAKGHISAIMEAAQAACHESSAHVAQVEGTATRRKWRKLLHRAALGSEPEDLPKEAAAGPIPPCVISAEMLAVQDVLAKTDALAVANSNRIGGGVAYHEARALLAEATNSLEEPLKTQVRDLLEQMRKNYKSNTPGTYRKVCKEIRELLLVDEA